MTTPHDWLKQPFAHRGLHDRTRGIIENTASAVTGAVTRGYGVEVDLRLAACGTVMVFHDAELSRLTEATGAFGDRTRLELQAIPMRGTGDRILALSELLAIVADRVPLLLELKSEMPAIRPLAEAVIHELEGYRGRFAVMSFDPELIALFHDLAPRIVRGLVSERYADMGHWPRLSAWQRFSRRHLLSARRSQPDFVAYHIDALPTLAPLIARHVYRRPLLTWTVRTPQQRDVAGRWADAMIFEGFLP